MEVVINQFSLDRDTNSKRIGELKHFLDRNIAMMKNNWDHKRCVEVQTDPYPVGSQREYEAVKVVSIWEVVNHYGESLKTRIDLGQGEREHHVEFLRLTQDIARNALDIKRQHNSGLTRYQNAALDFFVHLG